MKAVTVYRCSTRIGDYAYRTFEEAADHEAQCAAAGYPPTSATVAQVVSLPEGALWHGDVISAEVLHGQRSDDDGFDSGGTWSPVVGYVVPTRGLTFDGPLVTGIWCDIIELGTERVVGALNGARPDSAAAVRNITVIRRRDTATGSF